MAKAKKEPPTPVLTPYEKAHQQCKTIIQEVLIAGEGGLDVRLKNTLETLVETISLQTVPPTLQETLQAFDTLSEEIIFELEPLSAQKRLAGKILAFCEQLNVDNLVQQELAKPPKKKTKAEIILETEAIIREAVQTKRKIQFVYKGYLRVGDVYLLGTTYHTKEEGIVLYQSRGKSSSHYVRGFKNFYLYEMKDIQLLSTAFTKQHNLEDSFYYHEPFLDEILLQVDLLEGKRLFQGRYPINPNNPFSGRMILSS
ncbi:MAG: hypothetical protein NTW61_06840 [Candidatus Melainabacteria bacterium]|jgi:hypothetical protein|nr:hypothetical protein [Candidatus Melainabacteria bacterium]